MTRERSWRHITSTSGKEARRKQVVSDCEHLIAETALTSQLSSSNDLSEATKRGGR